MDESKKCDSAQCLHNNEDDDTLITCSGICRMTFHASCVSIDKKILMSIKQFHNLSYRCDECNDKDQSIFEMLHSIKRSVVRIEKSQYECSKETAARFENIEKKLEKSGEAVIGVMKKVDEEVRKVDETINEGKWNIVEKKKKKTHKNIRKTTLIVTPRDEKSRAELREKLKSNIDATDYDVTGLSNAPANGIAIICDNEEKCEGLIKEIENKFSKDVMVSKPKIHNPRIKLLKLHDADNDDNKLVELLKDKNPLIQNAELKIIKREKVKINGKPSENVSNVIMEVTPAVHNIIMSSRKLKHVWEIVKVVDNIYVRRCYNCLGFNHNANECRNLKACSTCAGDHSGRECAGKELKCINCVKLNERMKFEENSKGYVNPCHSTWSKECPVYKKKIENSKRAINTID